MTRVRIATRGSDLALAQARTVAARIEAALGVATELVVLVTSGDRLQQGPLAAIGGKGLFVKEIEEALRDGRADVAVHSAKDLPSALLPGLALAACPERADPRDALVLRSGSGGLASLRAGARVGTGSARRAAQLRALRPDLEVVPLRGKVPPRIRPHESENLDAVILASAGLDRLGLAAHIAERLAPDDFLPALGQGTLALETRAADALTADLAALNDAAAMASLLAERAFLHRLEGDCNVPIAGLASPSGGIVRFRGFVTLEDGSAFARGSATASLERAADAGLEAGERVLADGGVAILASLRAAAATGGR